MITSTSPAPIWIAPQCRVKNANACAVAATFLTSIADIATYQVLQLAHGGTIATQWILGALLGAGGCSTPSGSTGAPSAGCYD